MHTVNLFRSGEIDPIQQMKDFYRTSLPSTPNMTGRRFHRTMEVIPALPWKAKNPSVSTLGKLSIKQGDVRGGARYDTELPPIISIVRHPGRPVILGTDGLLFVAIVLLSGMFKREDLNPGERHSRDTWDDAVIMTVR